MNTAMFANCILLTTRSQSHFSPILHCEGVDVFQDGSLGSLIQAITFTNNPISDSKRSGELATASWVDGGGELTRAERLRPHRVCDTTTSNGTTEK